MFGVLGKTVSCMMGCLEIESPRSPAECGGEGLREQGILNAWVPFRPSKGDWERVTRKHMAEITPFRGWLYNLDRLGEAAPLMAPPYDVISPAEQEALYEASPHNVIRLILGKKKTGDSDWDNRYTRAADTLKRWVGSDILVRSASPCLYITSQTYDPGDGSGVKTRWGVIALVRIEDEDSGVILPHERTFSAHRDDRLRLMRATAAQFSPIFALYEDPENKVLGGVRNVLQEPPVLSFRYRDGCEHRMWVVDDPAICAQVADSMRDRGLLIADGHHRYETSRNYRNLMRARFGMRPSDRSFEFTAMYLSNMADPGLTVLPSHRLVRGPEDGPPLSLPENVKQWFDVRPLPWTLSEARTRVPDLRHLIAEAGQDTVAFAYYGHDNPNGSLLRLRPGMAREMGEDLHASLRKLDVLVLSRLVFQNSLGFSREELDNENRFHYESDLEKALTMVAEGETDMAFLLNPTRIEHVREVAANRLIMPRKSTYFFPKVLTGLVFTRMDPHEHIQHP